MSEDTDAPSKRGKLKEIGLYIKSLKPMLLSHHPNCEKFDNHIIKVGKYRLCIGCFIGYSSVIITLLLIFFLGLTKIYEPSFFFMVGMILCSFFILSPLNLAEKKPIKIIQKIIVGAGTAFLFWWIWTLPNLFFINLTLFFIVFGAISALLNAYHVYGFYRTCKPCEFSENWGNCPGFKKIYENFEKYGLPNIFKFRKLSKEDEK